MKIRIRYFTLFLIGLFLFSACQKDNEDAINLEATNIETLKEEISSSSSYQDFVDARNLFIQDILDQSFDLFELNNALKSRGYTSYCAVDIAEFQNYKGMDVFLDRSCVLVQRKKELYASYPVLATMSDEQRTIVFNDDGSLIQTNQSDSDVATNRTLDCLQLFQTVINDSPCLEVEASGDDNPFECDMYINTAINWYENCCERDDTIGCPP